jgi:hypothetical protein
MKRLSSRIASASDKLSDTERDARYRLIGPRKKIPQGVEYDDTVLTIDPNALLRPGIMLSSSSRTISANETTEETFETTSSGFLVKSDDGVIYITIATHGFHDDGLVYISSGPAKGWFHQSYREEHSGRGYIVGETELRYSYEQHVRNVDRTTRHRDSRDRDPQPPHLRAYDPSTINIPFTGSAKGQVLAIGAMIPESITRHIRHEWMWFGTDSEPPDDSCGRPLLNS